MPYVRKEKPGRGAKGGGEGKRALCTVDAGVVPGQPREAQHQLKMTQPGDLKGEVLRMSAMDTDVCRKEVSDMTNRGCAAIDEL